MAAAVDNEEVSMNPKDVLDDKTNWGSPKSFYLPWSVALLRPALTS